ncbi:MAG: hypothetical protein EAZ16_13030 [Sphingobacteriales bacterium]|jgi:hypothetical protein|nr:MAG: hypothetical protein EAZ16_13030 [Sphingobacteriales bacterium]
MVKIMLPAVYFHGGNCCVALFNSIAIISNKKALHFVKRFFVDLLALNTFFLAKTFRMHLADRSFTTLRLQIGMV